MISFFKSTNLFEIIMLFVAIVTIFFCFFFLFTMEMSYKNCMLSMLSSSKLHGMSPSLLYSLIDHLEFRVLLQAKNTAASGMSH